MICFKILSVEDRQSCLAMLSKETLDIDLDYATEIIDSLLEDEDSEYAISSAYGCMLIRVFDGGYSFIYPVALNDEADPVSATCEIRDYSIKEEIPLVFTDVPREELGNLISTYRHANIDALDEFRDSYRVQIMSEASLVQELPVIENSGVILDAITEVDDADYARLCRDLEVNRYWGYDYREDESDPCDSYFREVIEGEFSRGISMSFAVRLDGKFVGEALLYAFDHQGGCESAVRLLPEYTRQNIATRALEALMDIASQIGLITIYATVEGDNKASNKLCSKCFEDVEKHGSKVKYTQKM